MRVVKVLALVACCALSQYSAADSEPGSVGPAVRAELTALVNAWIDAEVQDDRSALEDILHEDFLSTFASGTTVGRTAYIDLIIAMDIPPFTVQNESIRLHGDTAVVIDVSDDGTTKFTWIAVRRDGDWKVIAQTFSQIASSPAS